MRLGTFNVENMFERPVAMNLATWADGKAILDDFALLGALIAKPWYSDEDKALMLEVMGRHRGLLSQGESKFLLLRDVRGQFLKKPGSQAAEIVASGRGDWIGWFELVKEPVREAATENTARVIRELRCDTLCVVEAEDRVALKRFNGAVLPKVDGAAYDHVMLIDGNDERGIDVGVLTRSTCPIVRMVSHVDDTDDNGVVFSRDCAEYILATPRGAHVVVLVNHFKSKGYGTKATADAKRLRQARRVREIYEARLTQGFDLVAIVGDLNDFPGSEPMTPLIADGSTLVDVMAHPNFVSDGRPGTHGNGVASSKLDYILMSPNLAAAAVAAGIERRGVWGGKNGTLFPHFEEIKSPKDAASDHAALWVDLDV